MDFSESIAACDLKTGTCTQLLELMKVSTEGQGHFQGQGHLHLKINIGFFRYHWTILNQVLYVSRQVQGNEIIIT